jgi:hypothetical protein
MHLSSTLIANTAKALRLWLEVSTKLLFCLPAFFIPVKFSMTNRTPQGIQFALDLCHLCTEQAGVDRETFTEQLLIEVEPRN